MEYMLCPACKKAQPAFILRSEINCCACKRKFKLKQFSCKECPDCGSLLYAPPAELEQAVFPCAQEHLLKKEAKQRAAEHRNQPARETENGPGEYQGQPAPEARDQAERPAPEQPEAAFLPEATDSAPSATEERIPRPRILCERCHEPLPLDEKGRYGLCPLCGRTPTDSYMRGQRGYIVFSWDPKDNELLYVPDASNAIPYQSILIVRDGQEAYYEASGIPTRFSEMGFYRLFYDPRTEEEIVSGVNEGQFDEFMYSQDGEGSSPLGMPPQLNTRIVYFNMRVQRLSYQQELYLLNQKWRVVLPIDLCFRIHSTETLRENQIDLSKTEAASEALTDRVRTAVLYEIKAKLQDIPKARLIEAKNREEIRHMLSSMFEQEKNVIPQSVNASLDADAVGMHVTSLRLRWNSAECFNTERDLQAVCPACERVHWKEEGDLQAIQCPCGAKLRWCISCRTFTLPLPDGKKCSACNHGYMGF